MGEPEGADITSTQKSLSSSHDPGWNDPPERAFIPLQPPCTPPRKPIVFKRVAFPLNSNFTRRVPSLQYSMSPPPHLPPPVPCKGVLNPSATEPNSKIEPGNSDPESPINKEEALSEALLNLDVVMEELFESEIMTRGIRKGIERMKTLWMGDKLDDCIYKKVLDISKALKEEDFQKADNIYSSLMKERALLCYSWIPGIQRMIISMRCKLTKFSDETNSELDPSSISVPSLE